MILDFNGKKKRSILDINEISGQYFPVVLFPIMYKVVWMFEAVNGILMSGQ